MRLLSKQSGFALLEVMIAGSLLAVLAYFGTKLMSDQMKGQKTVESRSEITALVADIRTVLANENSCTLTFGTQNVNMPEGVVSVLKYQAFASPPTPVIDRYPANPDPQLATPFGNGNIKILGYSLTSTDTQDAGIGNFSDKPDGSGKVGTINLQIRFYIGKHRTTGSEELIRKTQMHVELDPTGTTIEKCSAIGNFGVDRRFLHRWQADPDENRTMMGNLFIFEGFEVIFSSDRTLKTNIKSLNNLIPKLRKLRPVSYNWKSSGKKDNGLIAQEVREVFPDLVIKSSSNGKLSVNYIELTPLLLQGIQELDRENIKLKNQLSDLEAEQLIIKKELCSNNPSLSFCTR